MTDEPFPHLFRSWQSGALSLPNRLVMGAMHTGIEHLDRPEDRIRAFYRERAEGGIGLIITSGISPNPEGRMDLADPYLAPGQDEAWHRASVEAVRGTNTKICLQLLHAGRYAKHTDCVGASAQPARINRFAPTRLSTERVWQTVEDFAQAARLARELGYHGIEIMGSEGYLINQFTAEATNDRSDEFGGSSDKRGRFSREIVAAVRRHVPDDFLVIYRISAVDLVPRGATLEETRDLAIEVVRAGANMLNTGIGWHESAIPTIAAMVPRAAWSYAIRQVKEAVNVPVIASNRINDPHVAERLLSDGIADFVSLARPLLADPGFAAKAKANQAERIATCIACNQACLDRVLRGKRVSCMINPRAGHELDLVLTPAREPKRIAVVGGGAAGMNFAFNAASRGHAVTLFEAGSRLGGQLLMAREVPEKFEFNEALRYFENRLDVDNVTVRLNHTVSADELAAGGYDEIVIATGVRPRLLDIPGIDDPRVLSYAEVLRDHKPVGAHVAIIGAGGIGFDVAEYLLGEPGDVPLIDAFAEEYGLDRTLRSPGGLTRAEVSTPRRRITLMQRKPSRPSGIAQAVSTSWIHRTKLQNAQVEMLGGVEYRRIEPAGLVIAIEGVERTVAADTIIVCAGQESQRSLYDTLIGHPAVPSVHIIGGADVAGELDAVRAIDQATRLALAI
ncbi:NADPH-dependent 2,4-dienoyl-CoA reductase [Sphingomonas panacis]|uniref:NADPH-dependent 2,4-dienoyl-CoA reductase n=1 Tax=Sphingomonas panacis TaxID=1560345 RepID=A0A1B3ZHR5_9SPHN|nr:NADPH-dependent 2,4-dienoyl-CoA reductase [Sphingomonas panacis]